MLFKRTQELGVDTSNLTLAEQAEYERHLEAATARGAARRAQERADLDRARLLVEFEGWHG